MDDQPAFHFPTLALSSLFFPFLAARRMLRTELYGYLRYSAGENSGWSMPSLAARFLEPSVVRKMGEQPLTSVSMTRYVIIAPSARPSVTLTRLHCG